MMAGRKQLLLPEKYSATANEPQLTFERLLFNHVVEHCESVGLGVKAGNVEACSNLILALRDALQLMVGRENDFKWCSVPTDFKFGLTRKKKRKLPRLKQDQLHEVISRLRAAVDGNSFTRTNLWEGFVEAVESVINVLTDKLDSMRQQTSQARDRQGAREPMSPTMAVETVEASSSGTALMYSELERKLEAMPDYEMLALEHEDMRTWAICESGDGYLSSRA